MVKKAFMKTIEILMIILLTVFFMFVIMPVFVEKGELSTTSYLASLIMDPDFRAFLTGAPACYNSTDMNNGTLLVGRQLPRGYSFMLCTGRYPESLPVADVYQDTMFFAGNVTDLGYKVIRVYYWKQ
jgi:hypothetical protein